MSTARPARRLLRDDLVDLRLAADVDAARRLVEQQDVGVLMQQPADRHLLLIPARERAHRLPRASGRERAARESSGACARAWRARSSKPPRASAADAWRTGCRRSRAAARALRPCGPRSRSRRPRARRCGRAHPCARRRAPAHARRCPPAGSSSPNSARTSSVRPEPTRPAMPRISPRRSSKLAVAQPRRRGRGRAPRARPRHTCTRCRAGKSPVADAADHLRDELLVRRAGERAGADAASVAQHGVAIGDLRALPRGSG